MGGKVRFGVMESAPGFKDSRFVTIGDSVHLLYFKLNKVFEQVICLHSSRIKIIFFKFILKTNSSIPVYPVLLHPLYTLL